MLNEQTKQKLYTMRLNGMAEAYEEQLTRSGMTDLSFEDRFAMLVDRQWLWKENRSLSARLSYAKLKEKACFEDVDYRAQRGLQRSIMESLINCEWIRQHQNCIIIGPTGVGKTYLACALAHKACRDGFRALYYYAPKLFREVSMARVDGSMTKLLKKLAKTELLVIDDWGLAKIQEDQFRDFLEILDDRHGSGSTLMTSQVPVGSWHELISEPTVADAILDRLIHNAHKIELKGESMRKKKQK